MSSTNQKIEQLKGVFASRLAPDMYDAVMALLDSVGWAARGQSLAGCESVRAQGYNGLVSDARAAIDRAIGEPVRIERWHGENDGPIKPEHIEALKQRSNEEEAAPASKEEAVQRGEAARVGATGGNSPSGARPRARPRK